MTTVTESTARMAARSSSSSVSADVEPVPATTRKPDRVAGRSKTPNRASKTVTIPRQSAPNVTIVRITSTRIHRYFMAEWPKSKYRKDKKNIANLRFVELWSLCHQLTNCERLSERCKLAAILTFKLFDLWGGYYPDMVISLGDFDLSSRNAHIIPSLGSMTEYYLRTSHLNIIDLTNACVSLAWLVGEVEYVNSVIRQLKEYEETPRKSRKGDEEDAK